MDRFKTLKSVAWFVTVFFCTSAMIALVVAAIGGIAGYNFYATLGEAQTFPATIMVALSMAFYDTIRLNSPE